MSPKPLDFKELKAIVDWVNVTEDIREFSLKYGDVVLYVSRNQHASEGHWAAWRRQPHRPRRRLPLRRR